MIISPDEGSMSRAIYLANILGVDMGMYYKRLDYSNAAERPHKCAINQIIVFIGAGYVFYGLRAVMTDIFVKCQSHVPCDGLV